ncbi:MAG: tRNA pseudouridine(55) synthase TruB [Bacteroidia bacterium]
MNLESPEGEVLLINKPLTWTSFDVVNKVRWLSKAKKVGHAGTLDPLATGLLILCSGKKTKTIELIQSDEKEYTGTFYLGATTPSFDLETEIDQQFDISHLTEEAIRNTFKKFTGDIQQIPPMHSAIKQGGKRAYVSARKGETLELPPRSLSIPEFELTGCELPLIHFRVVCSKGTYIRAFARDIGQDLGVGAYLHALCRTRIGNYFLKDAYSIEDVISHYQMKKEKLKESKKEDSNNQQDTSI